MKRLLKRVGRALAGPFPVYFDRRFAAVHEHIDTDAVDTERILAAVAALAARIDALEQRLDGELQPVAELLAVLEREVGRLRDELQDAPLVHD